MKDRHPSLALQQVSRDSTIIAVESPFGKFRVKPHRTLPGEIELWLDESCWERFASVDAAMNAVTRGQLGIPDWDALCAAHDE